jgi:hypothetical protein
MPAVLVVVQGKGLPGRRAALEQQIKDMTVEIFLLAADIQAQAVAELAL